jgi:Ca2+/Na+ antiporter
MNRVQTDNFIDDRQNTNDKKIYFLNTTKGVTFLAFGNGAPDIFSAIAAIGNAKNGDAGLAFGALLGMICRIYHGHKYKVMLSNITIQGLGLQ